MKTNGGSAQITIQDLTYEFGDQIKGLTVPNGQLFPQKGRIREIDINMDGYPDIFVTLDMFSASLGK